MLPPTETPHIVIYDIASDIINFLYFYPLKITLPYLLALGSHFILTVPIFQALPLQYRLGELYMSCISC